MVAHGGVLPRRLLTSGAGGLLTLQPPEVLDDLRGFFFSPQRVRLVGVPSSKQPRRRVGGLTILPVFEALKVVVDVRLLALVHCLRFYHRARRLLSAGRAHEVKEHAAPSLICPSYMWLTVLTPANLRSEWLTGHPVAARPKFKALLIIFYRPQT